MALYDKGDVKTDFAYVLQFFSLISDGLGGVTSYILLDVQCQICTLESRCRNSGEEVSQIRV